MAIQLEFAWRDPESLRAELEKRTGLRIDLTITNNRSTMMSVRRGRARHSIDVRLHRIFLAADTGVLRSLAVWLVNPQSSRDAAVVDTFINSNFCPVRADTNKNNGVITKGSVFDLAVLFRSLNAEHFGDSIRANITWGRMPPARRRRSIRFGSYYPTDNLIRIHPLLDQEFVPVYFARYIVFHEMLHAYLGIEETDSGRRRYHTREFSRIEEKYPDYARALKWQSNPGNLKKLLR
ncbi:MAG TPA: hypothetical protein VMZ06_14585 [Candidatus Bathyarchaeia archaeon]|nr:hypothetical protein [Candidatus Bathyarchaeia archaeon]